MDKGLLFISILLIITMIFNVSYVNTLFHEKVHERIYEEYGINSEVNVKFFSLNEIGGTTKAISSLEHLTEEQKQEVDKLHALNEIYGYNTTSINYSLCLLTISVIVTGLFLYEKLGDKNE
jgi:hypothetical protein